MSSHHELIEKLSAKLENWDYQLDRLEHRIHDLPSELVQKAKHEIQSIKGKKGEFKQEIEAIEELTQEKFDEVTQSFSDVWGALKFVTDELELDIEVDV